MKTYLFGETALKKPILAYEWGNENDPKVLIVGTVHGDEIEGTTAALGLLRDLMKEKTFPYKLHLTLVPILNVDGNLILTRQNGRGVDLNRNLPTKNWTGEFEKVRYYPGKAANSEPENQALVNFLDRITPDFIITLHSWKPMLNVNGDCSQVAEAMQEVTQYKIVPDIGYPTPGSLGAYAADDRGIPTLTYEIERGSEQIEIIDVHVRSLHAGLKACEKRFSKP